MIRVACVSDDGGRVKPSYMKMTLINVAQLGLSFG